MEVSKEKGKKYTVQTAVTGFSFGGWILNKEHAMEGRDLLVVTVWVQGALGTALGWMTFLPGAASGSGEQKPSFWWLLCLVQSQDGSMPNATHLHFCGPGPPCVWVFILVSSVWGTYKNRPSIWDWIEIQCDFSFPWNLIQVGTGFFLRWITAAQMLQLFFLSL